LPTQLMNQCCSEQVHRPRHAVHVCQRTVQSGAVWTVREACRSCCLLSDKRQSRRR